LFRDRSRIRGLFLYTVLATAGTKQNCHTKDELGRAEQSIQQMTNPFINGINKGFTLMPAESRLCFPRLLS
jgi:hypothetical protein